MKRPFLLNFLLLIAALLLSVAVGAVDIPLVSLVRILASRLGLPVSADWPETFPVILFSLRIPHTILFTLAGAALAGSGAAYQGLFRNPLADPYLIGVASGAGLGAVAAMEIPRPSGLLGLYLVPALAFVAALITVGIVYSLAYTGHATPNTTLILAGVAVSSFATALTAFLMLRAKGDLHSTLAWLWGGATTSGWNPVLAVLPYILIGLAILLTCGHALNVLQFGEDQAQQLGLAVQRSRVLVIIAASMATSAAISFTGIIGFIGLIVPHLVRTLWGPDYRRLIPLSYLGGATLLLLADVLARRLFVPEQFPVGIVTALVGAPFFIWILRRSQAKD